ncbi:UPF0481 protein At3g47200-like [Prosopis cineraria]|uniref:UPF0481 protein At3g47200-like n=1 Tax=Prosopis cineraria TaxID=364024 RepID=UPI00240FFCC2|nr:UPF0481 protein At3g47200-like [Prosopis cineraria]
MDMEAMIQRSQEGVLLPECCIYKVPHMIRDQHGSAYTPKFISIGPFHYGDERLEDMERHKEIFFARFIRKSKKSLSDLVNYAQSSVQQVRDSYSEDIAFEDKDLMKMILRDAAFIIGLFCGFISEDKELLKDAKLSQLWVRANIAQDLLLLENQLPFFFIENLYNKADPCNLGGYHPSFRELTYMYFSFYNIQNLKPDPNVGIAHFTDLLRIFHLQEQKPQRKLFHASSDILLYSAHKLKDAGVKLKAGRSKCILDLKLSRNNHVLQVPEITVDMGTEILFLNMIALEQFRYPYDTYITDYVGVLDCLIDTDRDVDVLIHQKIIRNHLGDSRSVAELFNSLWKNTVPMTFSSGYLDLCKRLNDFYQDPWRKKKVALKRDYCKTAWQTTASIAGVILIILTFIQTIFSILQVVLNK